MAIATSQLAGASAMTALAANFQLGWPLGKTALFTFVVSMLLNKLWTIIIYPWFFNPLRHLPQPSGGSLINGHFKEILAEPTGAPQARWMKEVPNEGIIYYRTIFNTGRILLVSPKALAEVLVTKSYDFIKPPQIQQSIGRILGIGILFAEGDEHKAQRKNLNPAFAYRHLKDLYPIFWAKSQEMILEIDKELAARASGIPPTTTSAAATSTDPENAKPLPRDAVDASDWASRATLDIIGVAGLDQSFRAIQEPSNKLFQLYQTIFKPNRQARFLGLLSQFIPFWLLRSLPVKRNAQISEAKTFLRRTCMNIIQEKRAKMEASSAEKGGKQDPDAAPSSTGETDILSVALRSKFFTDDNLVDQLMTFLAAGHETTASALQWALLTLCQNPHIQTRLRQELHAAIATHNLPSPRDTTRSLTAPQLDALPYLHAFCAEVLRFHPPVPFTLRIAAHDTSILQTFVPKGTTVVLCPSATNRSPELWGADADTFDPERWIRNPGSGGCVSNFGLLTFLHGPRSCIGQGFARAEFAVLVAVWVAGFEMELVEMGREVEVVGGVTTKPKGGVRMRVKAI